MSSLCTNARLQSLSPLADSWVNDSLLQIIPHFNEALFQLVDVTYITWHYLHTQCCTTPQMSTGVQIWTVWRPRREVRTSEVGYLLLLQLNGVSGAMCRSAVLWKTNVLPVTCLIAWSICCMRQQDIAVILSVHLHPRVDTYQFRHCSINEICNLRQNLPFLAFDIFPR